MEYISGMHALNLECNLETCGDWHTSALNWQNITIRDSEKSIFGVYGIESDKYIPEHTEKYYVANHIRALLDLISEEKFGSAQGMRNDFIVTEKYDLEIFELIDKLIKHSTTDKASKIKEFMCKEYRLDWVNYMEGKYGLESKAWRSDK